VKALYRYIIKSFVGPMALTLVIALFILLMQFLWKYIDDLVGKGLSWFVITKFMIWVTLYLIPLALPMAVLLASIMTFGNLAENYELVALKSSGLSLTRIMAPLATVMLLISFGAFLFANYALPVINLKTNALIWDIQNTKPALHLQPDVFNTLNGFSIRIGEKDADQETMHNIMIYDHSSQMGNTITYLANSGKMNMSPDQRSMIFVLNDGNRYEEMMDNTQQRITHPMLLNHFKQLTIYFDLSTFRFSRTKEDLFKSDYQMMDMRQLGNSCDSLKVELIKDKDRFSKQIKVGFLNTQAPPILSMHSLRYGAVQDRMVIVDAAINNVRNVKELVDQSSSQFDAAHQSIVQRNLEWERKLTFPFACLLLFFIGAPLGAIIRKGGLGMPVVVAALFFVLYYILSIIGIKSAREEVMNSFTGSWLPAFVLVPVSIFLTYKAAVDSAIFERDAYVNFFKKAARFLKVSKS
jgi:lipopolysaccharide export system permease protein